MKLTSRFWPLLVFTFVGYQNTYEEGMTGYQFIIPTFVDVGSSKATYNLQNIIPVGAYGDGASDCLEIWADGYTDGSGYYWCTYDDEGCEEGQDGWYLDGERVTDVDLPIGTGLYANFGSDGVKIQYAGQVYQGTVQTDPLAGGYSIVGNSTPVPVNLQQIIPIGAYGDGASDCIEIWADGYTDGSGYYWSTYDDEGCEEGQDGWYLDGERVTDVTIKPGEGFYMNLGSEDVVIQLPDPLGAK